MPFLARIVFASVLFCASYAQQAEQLHISLTGRPGEMAVDFVAHSPGPNLVFWSTSPSFPMPSVPPRHHNSSTDADDSAAPVSSATSTWFEYNNATLGVTGWMNQALMTGLLPNTTYYYVVGNVTDGFSGLREFINEPADRAPIYAVLADFGLYNDESLLSLYKDAALRNFDFVIHAGDLAYDLDSMGGETGNEFMRSMDPYGSRYPVMACPGNHEQAFNFSQYQARFAALAMYAGVNSGSGSSIFYSFDVGLVHWIAFSTEVYNYSYTPSEVAQQLAWMRADLAKANANRKNVPWIIAFAHKGWYMDTTYWVDFDQILQQAGVDLFFCGHVHQYFRFVPNMGTKNLSDPGCANKDFSVYTDPQYMATIVSGAPGNREVLPSTCGTPNPLDAAFPLATCSPNYGYGYLQVFNETHVHWWWQTTVPISQSPDPSYADDLWLVVNQHGPRNL
eukprot:TRINITY_DN19358_c0_g1_i1.p1 TRINITY_DN19358_c0_g1~~TRINITY_DN19358_c0_g1_i1.p1  ORF type:complete len:480 (-),score=165.38 TRINITY_DN19358_c0_g1_i1:262-1611(-)